MNDQNATRAAGSSEPACSRDGQCPAKTKRNIYYCSASRKGVCKFGFNAIDRMGQCYQKSTANAGREARTARAGGDA